MNAPMAGSQEGNLSIPLSARSQGARSIHGDPALDGVANHDGRRACSRGTGSPSPDGVGFRGAVLIGYFAEEYALMAQNIVITLINVFGIYRWLIWKGKV